MNKITFEQFLANKVTCNRALLLKLKYGWRYSFKKCFKVPLICFAAITFHVVCYVAVCEFKRSASFKDQSARQMELLYPKERTNSEWSEMSHH